MLGLHGCSEKPGRLLFEVSRVIGGIKRLPRLATAIEGHFGMPLQVVAQTFGNDIALGYNADLRWEVLANLIQQQRIMGACQQQRINIG